MYKTHTNPNESNPSIPHEVKDADFSAQEAITVASRVHGLEYDLAELKAVEMFDQEMLNQLTTLVTPEHRKLLLRDLQKDCIEIHKEGWDLDNGREVTQGSDAPRAYS